MGNLCCGCFKSKNRESIKDKLIEKERGVSTSHNANLSFSYNLYDERNTANTLTCNQKKISNQDFEGVKLLGRGTFGKVLLTRKKSNGNLYAMKVLKKKLIQIKNQEDHTKTERKILEKIDHPFIVHLQYAFQDDKKLYLVTEFMQGGELFYHLRRERVFKETRAKFYLCEIVLALEHLHKNNCIYRDLKPENILLDLDGHIKLTDFGLSKLILNTKKDDKAYTICGTPEYLAPEILLEKGYDKSVDWWSLGALFYEMLCGYSPFKVMNNGNNKNNTGKLDLSLYTKKITLHQFISEDARSLIQALLTVEPKSRLGYGPSGSEKVKSHQFFKDVDWGAYLEKKIEPPFKPAIKRSTNISVDLSNFDRMFTEENIYDPSSDKNLNSYKNGHVFVNGNSNGIGNYDGFTYVKQSSLHDSDTATDNDNTKEYKREF
jgi:serine/threonine protein kinase